MGKKHLIYSFFLFFLLTVFSYQVSVAAPPCLPPKFLQKFHKRDDEIENSCKNIIQIEKGCKERYLKVKKETETISHQVSTSCEQSMAIPIECRAGLQQGACFYRTGEQSAELGDTTRTLTYKMASAKEKTADPSLEKTTHLGQRIEKGIATGGRLPPEDTSSITSHESDSSIDGEVDDEPYSAFHSTSGPGSGISYSPTSPTQHTYTNNALNGLSPAQTLNLLRQAKIENQNSINFFSSYSKALDENIKEGIVTEIQARQMAIQNYKNAYGLNYSFDYQNEVAEQKKQISNVFRSFGKIAKELVNEGKIPSEKQIIANISKETKNTETASNKIENNSLVENNNSTNNTVTMDSEKNISTPNTITKNEDSILASFTNQTTNEPRLRDILNKKFVNKNQAEKNNNSSFLDDILSENQNDKSSDMPNNYDNSNDRNLASSHQNELSHPRRNQNGINISSGEVDSAVQETEQELQSENIRVLGEDENIFTKVNIKIITLFQKNNRLNLR